MEVLIPGLAKVNSSQARLGGRAWRKCDCGRIQVLSASKIVVPFQRINFRAPRTEGTFRTRIALHAGVFTGNKRVRVAQTLETHVCSHRLHLSLDTRSTLGCLSGRVPCMRHKNEHGAKTLCGSVAVFVTACYMGHKVNLAA